MAKDKKEETPPVVAGGVTTEKVENVVAAETTTDFEKEIQELRAKVIAMDAEKLELVEAASKKIKSLEAIVDHYKELEVSQEKEVIVDAKEVKNKALYTYNGRKYSFTDNMPEKIRIDGSVMSQDEIMSNKEVIESMIDSGNIFVKLV